VRKTERARRVVRVRRRLDAIGVGIGLVSFGVTAALARNGLFPGEETIFLAINGWPDWVYVVLWPFMQYGMFLTIPVLTVLALVFRRYHLAISMASSGVGVYVMAKIVKEFVQRGRPGVLITTVAEREVVALNSLGFPSGHTAVAGAMTAVVTPYLRGRWKLLPSSLLVIVFVGRMYVSAHVPLDLVGGAAMGIAAGCAVNLIFRVPTPASTEDESDVPVISETAPA